jgi:hypothetical protein
MRVALATAILLAAGCATAPAVGPGTKVRADTRPECEAHCERLGMRLGAVVLIRSAAGCVCEPREAPPATGAPASGPAAEPRGAREGRAAVAGGALAIALQEEAVAEQDAARGEEIGPRADATPASSPGDHR